MQYFLYYFNINCYHRLTIQSNIIMKLNKLILILFVCLFSQNIIAQIGTGKTVDKPILIGKATKMQDFPRLEKYSNEGDNPYYILSFNNLEYPNIDDLKQVDFYANDEELEYLFDFLMGCFKTKDVSTIDVGDQTLLIKKTASSLRITVNYNKEPEPSGWFYLSKKQIERLFGKR